MGNCSDPSLVLGLWWNQCHCSRSSMMSLSLRDRWICGCIVYSGWGFWAHLVHFDKPDFSTAMPRKLFSLLCVTVAYVRSSCDNNAKRKAIIYCLNRVYVSCKVLIRRLRCLWSRYGKRWRASLWMGNAKDFPRQVSFWPRGMNSRDEISLSNTSGPGNRGAGYIWGRGGLLPTV